MDIKNAKDLTAADVKLSAAVYGKSGTGKTTFGASKAILGASKTTLGAFKMHPWEQQTSD